MLLYGPSFDSNAHFDVLSPDEADEITERKAL